MNLCNPYSKLRIVENDQIFDALTIRCTIEAYIHLINTWQLQTKDHIAIMPQRELKWVCFMYALMFTGHAPLLLDAKMDEATIDEIVDKDSIIVSDTLRHSVRSRIRQLPPLSPANNKDSVLENIDVSLIDALFTAHTSGTCGVPKKITYNTKNISWAVDEYAEIYNFNENETILFSLPFHYCYSVIPCCIAPFAFDKTIVIASEKSTTQAIAQLIERNQVNILVVNPFFYNDLSRLDLRRLDFSSLKICDSGGESIPLAVVKRIKEQTDVLITEGYGLTETTSLTHFLLPDSNGNLRIGSVGQACRGVEARIVDSTGVDVEAGTIGELLIRGPMVAPYDDPRHHTAKHTDEWFDTGDLFYSDEDGFFYFVSRKKDAHDVPLSYLSDATSTVPRLLENKLIHDIAYTFTAAAELIIFIVCDPTVNRTAMSASVLKQLPDTLTSITSVRFVAHLPRTSTGKVRKRDLSNVRY